MERLALLSLRIGRTRCIFEGASAYGIYTDNNDFMAASKWLPAVCAASDGPRTIRLRRKAKVVDALTGETVKRRAASFEVDMQYGETRVWKLEWRNEE